MNKSELIAAHKLDDTRAQENEIIRQINTGIAAANRECGGIVAGPVDSVTILSAIRSRGIIGGGSDA